MNTEQIVGLTVTLLVMCIGLAGSILPAIPSTPVVLLAAVGHKLYFGPAGGGWIVLTLLALFTVLSLVLDYVTTVYGARKFGATRMGAVGAVVGVLVGMFFSLPGILLGPFVGALAFEMAGGRDFRDSSRAGIGATIGMLAGSLGRVAFCLAMMALWTVNVVYRTLNLA